ncbi:MAG: 50S ribosomal protein L28 [Dehalococcoidia bacterium]|nr:50S ribosomal protein L28 [Dehalococcoidia bacterium]MQG15697.1 50S ribosomal protein L28 [SAR202 cluster bacterium]
MARCENCSRSRMAGNNVSHSKRRTKRRWSLNVQKATIDVNGTRKQVNLCTRCMRTSQKTKLSIQQ